MDEATAGVPGSADICAPNAKASGLPEYNHGAVTVSKPEVAFVPGAMKDHASKVLMKVLYGARMARMDLLRVVNQLACQVTKWDAACDRKLHRLMCYIKSTLHLRQIGWVGDDPSSVSLHLYADADFAGRTATRRSTSGFHLTMQGKSTPATPWPV